MGLLSKIIRSEPPKTAASDPPIPAPCPTCDGRRFWESVYRDGVARCCVCEPPPSESLVGRFLGHTEPPVAAEPAKSKTNIESEDPADWPSWMTSRIPIPEFFGDGSLTRTHLADPDRCDRCGSREFTETKIHNGQSTRLDCSRCNRFHRFSRWYGSDNTLPQEIEP